MTKVAKYAKLFWEYQDEYQEIFQEIFSRTTFSANIDSDTISAASVQLEAFIVNCHYVGHRCNKTRDFKKFFDPYYFNCFTYTAPENVKNDDSLAEGIENGWSSILLTGSGMLSRNKEIRMLPGIHEWRSPVSASEGVRIVIHPPNTDPYPFTEGYDVPPGFSASFGIRPRKNIRVGAPHGNCSRKNPFATSPERYRLMACQKMCIQKYVIAHCNCADVGLPRNAKQRDVKLCRNDDVVPTSCIHNASQECVEAIKAVHDKIQCSRSVKAKVTKNNSALEDCKCYPPCDEVFENFYKATPN